MNVKKIWGNKYIRLALKFAFTFLCLSFLYFKIDFPAVWKIMKTASLGLIFAATLLFILSKYISAVRLKVLFDVIHLPITTSLNLKLYLLGMYYNLFLPGGIGGDGYKVYHLKRKNKNISLKKILLALFFDRINGLILLGVLISILFFYIKFYFPLKTIFIVASILLLFLLLFISTYLFFRESLKRYALLALYSLGVQVLQLLSAYCLILSLHISDYTIEISFVFLLSTLAAMVPITIGGTGLRELTFIYFADYFPYDKNYCVTVAVLFFVITLLVSLTGLYFSLNPEKLEA